MILKVANYVLRLTYFKYKAGYERCSFHKTLKEELFTFFDSLCFIKIAHVVLLSLNCYRTDSFFYIYFMNNILSIRILVHQNR